MENYMSVNMIVIGIFFFILIIIAVAYRNSTLDKLPLLPGEEILFEESGIRVEQEGSPESAVFINCIVRVTDSRIIIAQKTLFSKKYALRHVISYKGRDESTSLKATFKKGYLNMTITVSNFSITESGNNSIIRIEIPESVLTWKQFIVYNTSRRGEYQNLFAR
jgi:hypothetical protein